MPNNYTLGRGRVYFAEPESANPLSYRYIGNTPELNLTIETEDLDHVSADEGVQEVDDSTTLSVTRSGTMICDSIQLENLAYFFFGTSGTGTQAEKNDDFTQWETVAAGEIRIIGVSAESPLGVRGAPWVDILQLSEELNGKIYYGSSRANARTARDADVDSPSTDDNAILRVGAGTAGARTENDTYWLTKYDGSAWSDTAIGDTKQLRETTDFTFDSETGQITFAAGARATGRVAAVYDTPAHTYGRVLSGSQPAVVAIRFVEKNPQGDDYEWIMPKVTLRPNGDIALKGDEWRQIPFALTVELPTTGSALIINGEPVNTA